MSQIQGYRIEVCRTTCDDAANWYALVANTGRFEHRYVHQVLAPGVIRENHYRVRAININGVAGPWSNVATLDATEVRDVYLQTPNDSTLWVRFRVRNPDGNLLYVRYTNTATGTVGHAQYRLTKKQDGVKLVLSGLAADSWYKVELDFNENFDSPRRQVILVRHGAGGRDAADEPLCEGPAGRAGLAGRAVARGPGQRDVPAHGRDRQVPGAAQALRQHLHRDSAAHPGAGGAAAGEPDRHFEPALFSNLDCKRGRASATGPTRTATASP